MLMQSSLPCYVEVALSYAYDFMKQGLSCDLMPGSLCRQHHLNGFGEIFSEGRKSDDDLCFVNFSRNCSQLETSSTMSRNLTPTFVYQRRRQRKNPVATFTIQPPSGTKPSDCCHSAISSEAPSLAAQQHVVSVSDRTSEAERYPNTGPINCNTVATVSFEGNHAEEEAGSEQALITEVDRVLNVRNTIDDCSSSKSNLELSSASLKFDTDDAGECSSSGALIDEEISARDICISILRSQGLLDKVWNRQDRASTENTGVSSDNYCSKSCRVCEHMESTLNMLICDNCEDAFHISCYNPHITIIPVGEWLCSSCLKKKHKILKDTEIGRNRYSASEGELGSLEFMLRDTEPYMSRVRIGDEFQANVPDRCGPIDESKFSSPVNFRECDLLGDPLEMDPSNNVNMQCREVIEGIGEGVDGTICGKWRRAPLFEVQTDDWECFCCVLWDPAHADCSVPQELDTEEVMKQLKYIEMLRPRLAAKRRKFDSSKCNGSQDPYTYVQYAFTETDVVF
ncbi:hypothetical protein DH2020_039651 [Rehmannia glutinosa]|uniref:Uncharacterized protein n=1 Tax=Rehmannia glutinosa TaxID=99300 RepID=A0ABR0UV84_REHGL